jgi:hypothetical protein
MELHGSSQPHPTWSMRFEILVDIIHIDVIARSPIVAHSLQNDWYGQWRYTAMLYSLDINGFHDMVNSRKVQMWMCLITLGHWQRNTVNPHIGAFIDLTSISISALPSVPSPYLLTSCSTLLCTPYNSIKYLQQSRFVVVFVPIWSAANVFIVIVMHVCQLGVLAS